MPLFRISVINATFHASDEHDLVDLDTAKSEAIRGALQVGTAEVMEGKPFFGAEVCVEHNGAKVSRYIVSVGVSPLR